MKLRHHLLPLLTLICLGLLLHLSQSHNLQWDWSLSGRNQLHPRTLALLDKLQGPLQITAFVPDHPVQRAAVNALLDKYRQHYPHTHLLFVDPSQQPEQARELGITHTPQLLVEYAGRQERIPQANEQLLTQAIARLGLDNQGWIGSLQGHGEASLLGQRNFDLGSLGKALQARGYHIIDLNLADTAQIPRNIRLLILAAPAAALAQKETRLLTDWLDQGGSLLWLADGQLPQALVDHLGLRFLPGTVVDAAAADLGIDQPTVAVARPTATSPLKDQQDKPVLMPGARAMMSTDASTWTAQPLLQTGPRSWNETGSLKGSISRDASAGEIRGPLTLALALSRQTADGRPQRLMVVGDSDVLSNSVIGNAANRQFGLSAIHWLMDNDMMVSIPPFTPADQQLRWGPARYALAAGAFMILLPLLLLTTGLLISWRRRRK